MSLRIMDNVLADPLGYRAMALALPFRTYTLGGSVFQGIAVGGKPFETWIESKFPQLKCTVTFFRKSPLDQEEPNFIHTDEEMGDWTAILYLNQNPPAEDGTDFWTHKETGKDFGREWLSEGNTVERWTLRKHVAAKLGRVVLFSAPLFHSRALAANYGEGEDARLIQVVFGTGEF